MNNPVDAEAAPARPQRPFTEYNVFFQLERESLLQAREDGLNNGAYTVKKIMAQERQVDPPENVALRPPQYRHLILPSDWYVVGSKYTGKGDPNSYRRDRKHRKTHGVISFVELTKLVSRKWKVVDPETKEYCRNIAQGELKRYRKELDEFIKIYGADAAKGKKRKPRKSKAKQVVQPQKKPEEPKPIRKAHKFDGECAFIPVDDDLHDDVSIDPIKKEGISNVAVGADFDNSLTGEDMVANLYAPTNQSNGHNNGMMNFVDRSIMQEQAPMYSITPCSQGNQKVSLLDSMSRSLSLPFNAADGYGDAGTVQAPAIDNVSTFQGRAVGNGNSHGSTNRFGQFGINHLQGTGANFGQFTNPYEQEFSCDMTQHHSQELQQLLHSQQQQQQQQTGETQNCVQQSYLSQFNNECALRSRRVSMESTRRSSMEMSRRSSTDTAFSQNGSNMMNANYRRSTIDTAFSQSGSSMMNANYRRSTIDTAFNQSGSNMLNANYRRSSLPIKPEIYQASSEFPQLSVQQELIIKNLAEEEKLRKSLQGPGDFTFGKMPIADSPTTNYPSAA